MRKNLVLYIDRINSHVYLPEYETVTKYCNSGPCPYLDRDDNYVRTEDAEKVPYDDLVRIVRGYSSYKLVYASLENR